MRVRRWSYAPPLARRPGTGVSAVVGRDLSVDAASLAHGDVVSLPVELFPYEPFAERVWELRHAVTAYDAWYIALAERLAAPLATIDRRLARVGSLRRNFVTPARRS